MEEQKVTNERFDFNFTNCMYEGTAMNGRMEGKGEYTFSSGTVYKGEFKDGMFHGKGVLVFPEGTYYKGSWKNGKLVEGRLYFKDELEYKENEWNYCTKEDRRFYHEVLADRSKKEEPNKKLAEGISPEDPNENVIL